MPGTLGLLGAYRFDLATLTGTGFHGTVRAQVVHLRPATCRLRPAAGTAQRLPGPARLAGMTVCRFCLPPRPWTAGDELLIRAALVADALEQLNRLAGDLPGLSPPPQPVETRWRHPQMAWWAAGDAAAAAAGRDELAPAVEAARRRARELADTCAAALRDPHGALTLPAAALLTELGDDTVAGALQVAQVAPAPGIDPAELRRAFRFATFGQVMPLAGGTDGVDARRWDAPIVAALLAMLPSSGQRRRPRAEVEAAYAAAGALTAAWLPAVRATQAEWATRPPVQVRVEPDAGAPNLDWLAVVRLAGGQGFDTPAAPVTLTVPAVLAAAAGNGVGEPRAWWDNPTRVTGIRVLSPHRADRG